MCVYNNSHKRTEVYISNNLSFITTCITINYFHYLVRIYTIDFYLIRIYTINFYLIRTYTIDFYLIRIYTINFYLIRTYMVL